MEQARYTLDPKKREDLYTEATRIIHEEKPFGGGGRSLITPRAW